MFVWIFFSCNCKFHDIISCPRCCINIFVNHYELSAYFLNKCIWLCVPISLGTMAIMFFEMFENSFACVFMCLTVYFFFFGKVSMVQVGFFWLVPPQKVLSVRLHSKSHRKSSKCQNLLTSWHLELFGGTSNKKLPCILLFREDWITRVVVID